MYGKFPFCEKLEVNVWKQQCKCYFKFTSFHVLPGPAGSSSTSESLLSVQILESINAQLFGLDSKDRLSLKWLCPDKKKKCSRSGQIFGQNLAAQGPWALRSTSLWGPESCPDALLLLIRFWSWLTKQGAYSNPTMGVCLWYLYTSIQPTRNTALWDWLKRWVGIPRWGPHLVLKTVFCAEVLGRCFSAIHLGWCLSVSLPPDWSGTEALLVFRLVSVKGWCAQWQISPQAMRGSVNLREG